MKYEAVVVQHRLQRPLGVPEHLPGDFHPDVEFPLGLRVRLELRQFRFHESRAIDVTDVTHDLLAARSKTELVIGAGPPPFRAHEPLASQLRQVGCRQSERGKRGKAVESMALVSIIVVGG